MRNDEEILNDFPDVYQWDNGTYDLCLFDKSITFIKQLMDTKCIRCDHLLVDGNESLLTNVDNNVRGVRLTCSKCNAPFFIHQHVEFDATN